jgi:hypothetical protein
MSTYSGDWICPLSSSCLTASSLPTSKFFTDFFALDGLVVVRDNTLPSTPISTPFSISSCPQDDVEGAEEVLVEAGVDDFLSPSPRGDRSCCWDGCVSWCSFTGDCRCDSDFLVWLRVSRGGLREDCSPTITSGSDSDSSNSEFYIDQLLEIFWWRSSTSYHSPCYVVHQWVEIIRI